MIINFFEFIKLFKNLLIVENSFTFIIIHQFVKKLFIFITAMYHKRLVFAILHFFIAFIFYLFLFSPIFFSAELPIHSENSIIAERLVLDFDSSYALIRECITSCDFKNDGIQSLKFRISLILDLLIRLRTDLLIIEIISPFNGDTAMIATCKSKFIEISAISAKFIAAACKARPRMCFGNVRQTSA